MTQNADKKRNQIQMFCMDDMVPKDHLLRMIENAIDWNFIYGLVKDKYCHDNGRPIVDQRFVWTETIEKTWDYVD